MTSYQYTLSKLYTDYIDEELFNKAIKENVSREKGADGIGTLSEKTVHAVLKYYYVPDKSCHEIKVIKEEDFVADACIDGEIYEIQSKSFYTMKEKLKLFLKNHDVTIVYPVAITKYLKYVDIETGEIKGGRKSSKRGSVYDILTELYGIKELLNNKRLHFIISFIEMEEYKLLDGWSKDKKRGATKTDRIPTKIIGEIRINRKKDFLNFLPGYENGKRLKDCSLPKEFTTRDIEKLTGFNIGYAQYLLNILGSIDLIENIGKSGRLKLYKIK